MPTRIVHIHEDTTSRSLDLSKRRSDHYDNGTYLVFWYKGVPVGHAWCPVQDATLSSRQLRRLHSGDYVPYNKHEDTDLPWPFFNLYERRATGVPDWELPDVIETDSFAYVEPDQTVGVVICTVGRVVDLQKCLHSVESATPPPDEVIVVDNSVENSGVAEVCDRFPLVKRVREPVRGLSVARNRGIAAASASIIAFTDDDAIVPAHWIGQIRKVFKHNASDVITGSVLPESLETIAQDKFQFMYRIFDKGFEPATYTREFLDSVLPDAAPVWEIGAGVNMAVRREVFLEVGGFDELLGAGRAGVGEDSELWHRCLEGGLTCSYVPGLHMYHTHRKTMGELRRQIFLYWRGHVVTLLRQHQRTSRPEDLHRAQSTLPRHSLGWLRQSFRQRNFRNVVLRLTELRGLVAGWVYYWRHRRVPEPETRRIS